MRSSGCLGIRRKPPHAEASSRPCRRRPVGPGRWSCIGRSSARSSGRWRGGSLRSRTRGDGGEDWNCQEGQDAHPQPCGFTERIHGRTFADFRFCTRIAIADTQFARLRKAQPAPGGTSCRGPQPPSCRPSLPIERVLVRNPVRLAARTAIHVQCRETRSTRCESPPG